MKILHNLLLAAAFWNFLCLTHGWKDCKFEMIGQLNQSSNVIQMDLKLKRINREQYAISGSVNVFEDMLTDYTVDADAYYSAYGNNQFTQLPYKFKPKILCDALNTYYREFWMNELEPPISDLPFSKDKNTNLCPMFIKKKYTITNYIFQSKNLPKVLSTGLYKGNAYFRKDGIVENALLTMVSLT